MTLRLASPTAHDTAPGKVEATNLLQYSLEVIHFHFCNILLVTQVSTSQYGRIVNKSVNTGNKEKKYHSRRDCLYSHPLPRSYSSPKSWQEGYSTFQRAETKGKWWELLKSKHPNKSQSYDHNRGPTGRYSKWLS